MKILLYECRKILNIKLLVVLCLFTILFYDMFMGIVGYPEHNASSVAENDLVAILRDEYGYDTYLPYEDYAVLEEIRQEQFRQLDVMVQESSILQNTGIASFRELESMDDEEMDDAVQDEKSRIIFEDGQRQNFLKQQIEGIYDSMAVCPIMGVEAGKEMEAADTFLMYGSLYDDYTEEAVRRVAEVIKENRLSLMPSTVMICVQRDFPLFSVLLVISCLLFILPYQIRERLAGVNPLLATTHTGRGLWNKRYASAVLSSILVCAGQCGVFCLVLEQADVLQYWGYAVSGNDRDMFWFDMNFGTYLILCMILYTVGTIGIMTVFYLISRLSTNYIAGVAIGVPVSVVLGLLFSQFTSFFMSVERSMAHDVLRPIGFVVVLLMIAAVIVYCLHRWDKRRDIFV